MDSHSQMFIFVLVELTQKAVNSDNDNNIQWIRWDKFKLVDWYASTLWLDIMASFSSCWLPCLDTSRCLAFCRDCLRRQNMLRFYRQLSCSWDFRYKHSTNGNLLDLPASRLRTDCTSHLDTPKILRRHTTAPGTTACVISPNSFWFVFLFPQ